MKCSMIFNIPHSSSIIPSECRNQFAIDYLDDELRIMTDWYTDEIFAAGDIKAIIAPVSRLIVDTERFKDDDRSPWHRREWEQSMADRQKAMLSEKSARFCAMS